jgi:UPF0755 protein
MKRFFLISFLLLVTAGVASGVMFHRFAHAPLPLPTTPFEFTVKQGASLKAVAKQLSDAKLLPEQQGFWLLGRLTEQAKGIQAGTYRLEQPLSPLELLQKLNDGDVVALSVTFTEGVTFAEMRAKLETAEGVKVTLKGVPDADVMKRVGATEAHPEGLFFPDTYRFAAGTTDVDLLKASYHAMKKRLNEAWTQRDADLPYSSPYDVLKMASIIEKETGKAEERPLIGSVFINRLRIPMRLQTDPTVIYGMGESFDGNIRKRDLTTDTPYNTYTRDGLPPTPIAMPGWGSLLAAVKPATSKKLYFVGKGDGSHYFSSTLEEHNRAVAKYQLGR